MVLDSPHQNKQSIHYPPGAFLSMPSLCTLGRELSFTQRVCIQVYANQKSTATYIQNNGKSAAPNSEADGYFVDQSPSMLCIPDSPCSQCPAVGAASFSGPVPSSTLGSIPPLWEPILGSCIRDMEVSYEGTFCSQFWEPFSVIAALGRQKATDPLSFRRFQYLLASFALWEAGCNPPQVWQRREVSSRLLEIHKRFSSLLTMPLCQGLS